MQSETEIETGIDFQTQHHASDIEAWVDDYDEYAVVWAIKRVQDDDGNDTDLLELRTYYCEAGMRDEIGGADVFEYEDSPSKFARQELLTDAETHYEDAKAYWN